MRKKIVAGNWKMNLNYAEAMALAETISGSVSINQNTRVILAPSFPFLHEIADLVHDHVAISVAAQNCSDKDAGAYTGEVSAAMLASIGVEYVIIGHSERRNYFREDNILLAKKINSLIGQLLLPVYCCGETSEERRAGKQLETVKKQLTEGLFHLNVKQFEKCIIAYEPVWAIGTGENATPSQAQEMHQHIRKLVNEKFGEQLAGNISILYGGSVNLKNAFELFSCPDVDGGLIGGASLNAAEFLGIIKEMEKIPT